MLNYIATITRRFPARPLSLHSARAAPAAPGVSGDPQDDAGSPVNVRQMASWEAHGNTWKHLDSHLEAPLIPWLCQNSELETDHRNSGFYH